MKKSNDIKLYNMIFPLYELVIFPITWIVVLPANFIIDSVVLLLTIKCLKLDDMKLIYKKSILRVYLFGFLADFIGGVVMTLPHIIPLHKMGYADITDTLGFYPFQDVYTFLYTLFATAIAGYFIYLFNYKFSFKKLEIEIAKKKKLALSIAIFTAPYLFFFPSEILYRNMK